MVDANSSLVLPASEADSLKPQVAATSSNGVHHSYEGDTLSSVAPDFQHLLKCRLLHERVQREEEGTEKRTRDEVEEEGERGEIFLSEPWRHEHVFPLFSEVMRHREANKEIYLANHSLGQPPNATFQQITDGAKLWFSHLDEAWGPWMDILSTFRKKTAALLNLHPAEEKAHCIIPKASVGQALRAILGSFPIDRYPLTVMATSSEFDSVDVVLKQWQHRERINIEWIKQETPNAEEVIESLLNSCKQQQQEKKRIPDLLFISHAFFASGKILGNIKEIVDTAHAHGIKVFLDCYHSYGVVPIDLEAMGVDFATAGSYKYLRGGPGCCWLYVSPKALTDPSLSPLDVGWFAKEDPFDYARSEVPRLAKGGDGWLESTFSPLPFYQAVSGLDFVSAIGVKHLRKLNLEQKRYLSQKLREKDIKHFGEGEGYGAFITVEHCAPEELVKRLKAHGLNTDARAAGVRVCPDILTTKEEMDKAVEIMSTVMGSLSSSCDKKASEGGIHRP